MRLPKAVASWPFIPRGLAVFRSPSYAPLRKTDIMGTVCIKHCRLLFMKQVLPRFCRPTKPGRPSERCGNNDATMVRAVRSEDEE
jgi:hypothetical protein